MIVSQAKLAQLLGITSGRVSQLKADGRLVLIGDGVDLAATIERLRETADPNKRSALRLERAAAWLHTSQSDADEDPAGDSLNEAAPPAYREARARKEKALADIAELEYLLATGEVIALADVDYILADIGTSAHNNIENSPDRLAPVLIHKTAKEIEATLLDMLRETIDNTRETTRRHMDKPINGGKEFPGK